MWVIFNNFFVFIYCNIICFPPLIFLFRIFIIIKVKSNFLCYANARRVGLADDPSLLCSFISYSICFHFSIISPPVLHLEELAWWDFNFLVVWKFLVLSRLRIHHFQKEKKWTFNFNETWNCDSNCLRKRAFFVATVLKSGEMCVGFKIREKKRLSKWNDNLSRLTKKKGERSWVEIPCTINASSSGGCFSLKI